MESDELIAILREVRERVRARHPESAAEAGGIALPDLEPLVRARDAALAKVAAIGTVNPRPGGFLNDVAQRLKSFTARALDWHVREQVVFNRQAIAAVDAAIEALTETNRALAALGSRVAVAEELKDIRDHWAAWSAEWERKLEQNEVRFLRSVADLQAAYAHRADLMDANYRDALRTQHADFAASLARTASDMETRFRADLERLKLEYEHRVDAELQLIRQRLQPGTAGQTGVPAIHPGLALPPLDYSRLALRFRGAEEQVRAKQRAYLPYFAGCKSVLDIGCGRGEFLELLREANVSALGIDASSDNTAACLGKGLAVRTADLFEYLSTVHKESLDGIFCSQLVEHLAPERVPAMIKACASRLAQGGVIVIETPNPECLAIFSTYFYLDPTHVRPVPWKLLEFYFQESGIATVEVRRSSPAVESMTALEGLDARFREEFFGGLDYAIVGRKV